jgi:hypothetical protein
MTKEHFMTIKTGFILAMTLAVFTSPATFSSVHADETVGEKAAEIKDDTVKHSKKAGRKAKKKWRKATGQESAAEDIKESAQNTGDSIGDKADDMKKKVD